MDGREGTVYYQVIHGRVARQINTSCKLFPAEWSKRHSRIVITPSDEDRRQYLLLLDKRIAEDTDRLENVITVLGRKGGSFTADDVTSAFHGEHHGLFFLVFYAGGHKRPETYGKGTYRLRPIRPRSTVSFGSWMGRTYH